MGILFSCSNQNFFVHNKEQEMKKKTSNKIFPFNSRSRKKNDQDVMKLFFISYDFFYDLGFELRKSQFYFWEDDFVDIGIK